MSSTRRRGPHRWRLAGRPRLSRAAVGVPDGLVSQAGGAGLQRGCGSARRRATRVGELQTIAAFFHPLDRVGGWNRLYGRGGLVQYQLVRARRRRGRPDRGARTPRARRAPVVPGRAEAVRAAKPGLLSFPMHGWTLALDLPAGPGAAARCSPSLRPVVVEAGGRVYLAKDSRLSPETFAAMYAGPRSSASSRPGRPGRRLRSPTSPAACASARPSEGRPTMLNALGRAAVAAAARRHQRHRPGRRREVRPRTAGSAVVLAARPGARRRTRRPGSPRSATTVEELDFEATDTASHPALVDAGRRRRRPRRRARRVRRPRRRGGGLAGPRRRGPARRGQLRRARSASASRSPSRCGARATA